jgi:hypothetical protein
MEELSLLDPTLALILAPLLKSGSVPYPSFGYELLDAAGQTTGSFAEAAWPEKKTIITLPNDDISKFKEDEWTIFPAEGLISDTILKQLKTKE